jgi:hypothetical protein
MSGSLGASALMSANLEFCQRWKGDVGRNVEGT